MKGKFKAVVIWAGVLQGLFWVTLVLADVSAGLEFMNDGSDYVLAACLAGGSLLAWIDARVLPPVALPLVEQ